ncbi:MAG: redox-sensing transcriptional repressor Rex [Planctomycetota bacterium]
MAQTATISDKTIARLSLYRRLLQQRLAEGAQNVFSHELARMSGNSAALVRRDLMSVGGAGSPTKGYDAHGLAEAIGVFLDAPEGQNAALVGIGNLGRALLAYFAGKRPRLAVTAAFDTDPRKTDRVIHGCRCYPLAEMEARIAEHGVDLAVLATPAGPAQETADRLVRAGVHGILNFAPVRLRAPAGVYVEDIDVAMALEKVAFFARQRG